MERPTKLKTTPARSVTGTAIRSLNGSSYPGYPKTVTDPSYLERYEWMRDFAGMKTFNHCEHYLKWCARDRLLTDGSNSWYQVGNPSQGYWIISGIFPSECWNGTRYGSSSYGVTGAFGAWDEPVTGLPVLFRSDASGRMIIPPGKAYTDSLVDKSLRAMLPGIRPSLSILNSVYELKDITTAVRTIDRIKKALASYDRLKEAIALSKQALKLLSGKGKGAYARASLRSMLKLGSDAYLQEQFNISPLLKDIAGAKSAVLNARKQVNDLIAGAGRLQKRHFRWRCSDLYVPRTETKVVALPNVFVNTSHTGIRTVTYPTAMFYATIEYSYRMPYLDNPEDYLPRAVNDVMGINLNPAIIWNAIPWSFAIDWVFGVSRWLDQFAIRNIEPVTSISRYCYTYHIEREIRLSHGEGGNVIPFARYGEEAYIRKPHRPDVYRSIESSGLNPKEFTLAGALALSR